MNDLDARFAKTHSSARALVAFFGQQFATELTLVFAAPDVIEPEHVCFPAGLQERGLWGLRTGRPLSVEDRVELTATFAGVLGATPISFARPPDLMRLEAKMELARETAAANVISLTAARRRRQFPVGEVVGPAAKRLLKRDCLIEAPDQREIHKLAFELHARGTRVAFIPYADLTRDVRTCFTSLLNLGDITLFVPDLLALDLAEQRTLSTLTDFYWNVRPLVMFGTRRPLGELRAHPGVDAGLLRILTRSHVRFEGLMSRDRDLDPFLSKLEVEDEG